MFPLRAARRIMAWPDAGIVSCRGARGRSQSEGQSALVRAQLVEARLLLIRERAVKILKRRLHDLDRLQHGVEPLLHCRNPPGRCQSLVRGTIRLEHVSCPHGGVVESIERAALSLGRMQRLFDPLRRGVAPFRGLGAAYLAEIGYPTARAHGPRQLRLRGNGIEALLLLIGERVIEALEDGPYSE